MRLRHAIAAAVLIFISCSSAKNSFIDADKVVELTEIDRSLPVTDDNADEILGEYSIDFTIPNPLFGEEGMTRRRETSRSAISVRATLLDDYSTEADIIKVTSADSLSDDEKNARRKSYIDGKVREGMFRIRLTMDSGFSDKSMEPDHWDLYLENVKGIQLEATEIIASPVFTESDSVYSQYRHSFFRTHGLKRDITMYFKRVTFFGEDLLGSENPHIVFVISREQKVLARIAWRHSSTKETLP